ncbi:MAG: c-type cytochrome [Deltaproteobacteria bacterium]|nr:c-type cytochrome [Deltaproteobacteria bacterium]
MSNQVDRASGRITQMGLSKLATEHNHRRGLRHASLLVETPSANGPRMNRCLTSLLFVGTLAGCPSEPKPNEAPKPPSPPAQPAEPTPPPAEALAPTADDAKTAAEIFATRCTPCHGATGAGDGPASAGLTPKPANLTNAEWQGKVTDDHIEKIVVYGGVAVAKSPAMPPNPDLDSKPGVVKALRAHIRGLKK